MTIKEKVKNVSPSVKLAIVISIVALAWIMSGVLFGSDDVEKAQNKVEDKKPFYVRTEMKSAEDYIAKISITGQTYPYRAAQIAAEVDGRVVLTPTKEGAFVKKDETLVVLDENAYEAALKEAKEALKQAEIEYKASSKLTSKQFNSEIRLAQTKAALESARADVERAQINLDNLVIKAPYDGILEERFVDVGDYVRIADPVIDLVDLTPIKIVGFVTEAQIGNISKGSKADITLADGREFVGLVTFLSSAANEDTRTFRVEIEADNPNQDIIAGLTAKIVIEGKTHEAYFVSPSVLTLADDGQVGVKIVDNNDKAQFKPIKILADTSDGMWIEGLPSQVEMIILGQEFVANNVEINRYEEGSEAEDMKDQEGEE